MRTRKDSERGDISREALIDFFRQIILTDWGYKEVKDAGDKSVLTKFTGPYGYPGDGYIDFRFLKSKVFEEDICSKISGYTLELSDESGVYGSRNRILKKGNVASLNLFDDYIRFFNPDIVYSHFDKWEKGNHNLFVLERRLLTDGQKGELAQRGESWLRVLYNIQNEMKTFRGWGWHLSKGLEYLIAKVDPEVERDFVHRGRVTGFFQEGKGEGWSYEVEGMKVDNFDPNSDFQFVILIDGFRPEGFSQLIGQEVRYHFVDLLSYPDENGYLQHVPYGKLVST